MESGAETMSEYRGPDYPTEPHGNIPAFHSYEEETEFWATHDAVNKEPFEPEPPPTFTKQLMIRVDPALDRKLTTLARKRGLKKASLIRMALNDWLDDQERHAS
jgi:hypothetical protein